MKKGESLAGAHVSCVVSGIAVAVVRAQRTTETGIMVKKKQD